MKNVIVLQAVLLAICSCRKDTLPNSFIEESHPDFRVMEFTGFKIEVPYNWTYSELVGIDSYVGQINFSSAEYSTFDLGLWSNQLNADNTTHDISYTTIDGRAAKIVKALDPENGVTGVYFSSIESGTMNRFNLYTMHATASQQ